MNTYQKNWFLAEIVKNKGSQSKVVKEDIVRFALECGLEVKSTTAKEKIINKLCEAGYEERLYNEFSEFFYVPIWEVARVYELTTQKITALTELGIINEAPVEIEYKGRDGRFKAMAYPIEALGYDLDYIKGEYEKVFTQGIFRIRLETKTEEEVKDLVKLLANVLEIVQAPQSYEHRSKDGYYSYFNVRPIQNTAISEKRLIKENAALKNEIFELKNRYQEKVEQNNKYMQQIYALKMLVDK